MLRENASYQLLAPNVAELKQKTHSQGVLFSKCVSISVKEQAGAACS